MTLKNSGLSRFFLGSWLSIVCGLLPLELLAWTEVRDFNVGVLGTKVNMEAQGNTVLDNGQVLEGAMSARLTSTEGETGYGTWGGIITHPERLGKGDEVWFRVNVFFPAGFDYHSYGEGNRLKFLRFSTLSAAGNNEGYNDIYIDQKGSPVSFKYIKESGGSGWRDLADSGKLPEYGVWETYEFYVKFDNVSLDDGGMAVVRFWKNGKLLKQVTDQYTLNNNDSYSARTLLFTYWNGGAPKTQSMWVDDVILTSDQPAALDEYGNPYIGVRQGTYSMPAPSAPQRLSVTPN